jgi:hypothetical protein
MTTFSRSSALRTSGALRGWIASRPLWSYFVIAFGVVWLALLPFVLGQSGFGLLPYSLPDLAVVVLFIGGTLLGPIGSALIVTAATEGQAGIRRFLRQYVRWRVGLQWYTLALLGYFALYLAAALIAGGPAPLHTFAANWPLLGSAYPLALLNMILFPALAEEPNSRGYVSPGSKDT